MPEPELSLQAKRDLELLIKYRQGDTEAAEELFAHYKPLVISRANRYYLQGGEAEDLIQEGMIGLFQAVESYDTASGLPFSALADMLIRARLIDAVRSGTRKKHQIMNESISLDEKINNDPGTIQELLRQSGAPSLNPEEKAIAQEEVEALQAFMHNKLSPLEAQVVALIGQGCSYREAAEILEKDNKSIDNAVQRIRRKMRRFKDESSE
ncbi:MAG: sigma-70 family RNA polymerase sigma factor [Saccharofermentanales bacterium]|jgi:RNA polymerase sporulation-specific sigma factor|nr:sigma-70 family RNA polymerase sigma factor [Bacillota bacterium]